MPVSFYISLMFNCLPKCDIYENYTALENSFTTDLEKAFITTYDDIWDDQRQIILYHISFSFKKKSFRTK